MPGGVRSTTVTVPVHVFDKLPEGSVAVRDARVEPSPYGPAGLCASVIESPSASDDALSMEAAARQDEASAVTVTFLHRALGAVSQRNEGNGFGAIPAGTPKLSPSWIIRASSLVASSQSIKRCLTRSSIAATAFA